MRALTALFLFVAGTLTASAVEPSIRWNDDLRSGWAKSQETGRLMVIFVTSNNCHYCDLLKQNTWSDSGIKARVQNDFIPIRLNVARNRDIVNKLGVTSYPTIIIADPSGRVLDHHAGYQPAVAMSNFLSRNQRTTTIAAR